MTTPLNSKCKKPFRFIPIPKTGCVSIRGSELFPEFPSKNSPTHLNSLLLKADPAYFSFAVIRNPYDRLVSANTFINMILKLKAGYLPKTRKKEYNSIFEELVDNLPILLKPEHHYELLTCQYDYVYDKDGVLKADYLCDFYNLNEEFRKVQELNGCDIIYDLKHLNKGNHAPWRTYYTDELAEKVYTFYKKDFDFFNFDKYSYKLST